jgi:hypothetical protein
MVLVPPRTAPDDADLLTVGTAGDTVFRLAAPEFVADLIKLKISL